MYYIFTAYGSFPNSIVGSKLLRFGQIRHDEVANLGAIPLSIPIGEFEVALTVGVVDGVIVRGEADRDAFAARFPNLQLTLEQDLSEPDIIGTGEADALLGTDVSDFIDGRGGRDTIKGFGDDDVLHGGGGRDRMFGDSGDDVLLGEGGRDTLVGGAGSDSLMGGRGNDVLKGGGFRDTLEGGSGRDRLEGGRHADTLQGEAGRDTLMGGSGNDSISGGVGNDRLFGGSGRDILIGGAGNDVMRGGSGADSFIFTLRDRAQHDRIADYSVNDGVLVINGDFDEFDVERDGSAVRVTLDTGDSITFQNVDSDTELQLVRTFEQLSFF